VDKAVNEQPRQYPADAPWRRAAAHGRSYAEVRRLVLLLAEQPVGGDVAEELKRMVARADYSWPQ
jgi:hypothetical protein